MVPWASCSRALTAFSVRPLTPLRVWGWHRCLISSARFACVGLTEAQGVFWRIFHGIVTPLVGKCWPTGKSRDRVSYFNRWVILAGAARNYNPPPLWETGNFIFSTASSGSLSWSVLFPKALKKKDLAFPLLCLWLQQHMRAPGTAGSTLQGTRSERSWRCPGDPWAHMELKAEMATPFPFLFPFPFPFSFPFLFPCPFTSHWKHCKQLHRRWIKYLGIFNTWVCIFPAELCTKFDRDLEVDLFQLRSHRRKRDLPCPDEVQSFFTNWDYLQAFALWGKNNLIQI